MKCEICHNADAACVIHEKQDDGSTRERYVCRACAAQRQKKQKPSKSTDTRAFVIGPGETPPAFVEDLLKATLGFVKGMAETDGKPQRKPRAKTCSACGLTRERLLETGVVGCPNCWTVFEQDIREHLLAGQYRPHHTGTKPEYLPVMAARADLERRLKRAIAKQEFEKAAEIRRQLEALGGRTPRPNDPERPS